MDETVLRKLMEKVTEFASHSEESRRLAAIVGRSVAARGKSASNDGAPDDGNPGTACIMAGIMAGRLYNAFYYQTRRVLHRNPAPDEFEEFLGFVGGSIRDPSSG